METRCGGALPASRRGPCARTRHEDKQTMVNVNRFTEKAREALIGAQEHAEQRNHNEVAPEHLLAVLVEQEGGVVPELLRKLQLDPRQVAITVNAELDRRPK